MFHMKTDEASKENRLYQGEEKALEEMEHYVVALRSLDRGEVNSEERPGTRKPPSY